MVIPKGIDFSFILSVREPGGAPVDLTCLTSCSHKLLKLSDSTVVAPLNNGVSSGIGGTSPYPIDTTKTSSDYSPTSSPAIVIPEELDIPVSIPPIPGISGTSPTAGSRLYLRANAKMYVGSNTLVHGATNGEIYVIPGTSNILFDEAVATVKLAAKLSSFSFAQQGNILLVIRGDKLIVGGAINPGVAGTTIVFADGAVLCSLTGTAMTLGGTLLTDVASKVTPTTVATGVVTLPYTAADLVGSIADMHMDANAQVYASTGVITQGGRGFEDLYVLPGATGVVFGRDVERVLLPEPMNAYMFSSAGNQIVISKGSDNIVTGEVAINGLFVTFLDVTVKVTYTSGIVEIAKVSLTAAPAAVVPLLTYPLGGSGTPPNLAGSTGTPSTVPVGGTTIKNDEMFLAVDAYAVVISSMKVYGNSGTEGILLAPTALNVIGDSKLERVVFPRASAAYEFAQEGNQVVVKKFSTTIFKGSISSTGLNLVFMDGNIQVSLVNGVVLLGGIPISSSFTGVTTTLVCATEGRLKVTFSADITKRLVARRGDASDYYYLKPTYYYVGVLFFDNGHDPIVATINNIKIIETGV